MKFFLDSGDIKQVEKWLPIIDGVTTNPSIIEKDGDDLDKIVSLIPLVSVEVCGDYYEEAIKYHQKGFVIKIPLLHTDGSSNIDVISELTAEGVEINCTALMSLSQVILAEKAGARYASLFAGRVEDEGGDSTQMIRDCVSYLTGSCELIVGSIRTVGNVLDAIRAGAHIITIPPPILEKMLMHHNSLRTVREFEDASRRLSKRD